MVVNDAEKLKDNGNQLLKQGDFNGAIEKYSEAIKLDETNYIYFSNRSLAHVKASQNTSDSADCELKKKNAVEDAKQCVKLAPSWVKGHLRLRDAFLNMGDEEKSKQAAEEAKRLTDNNSTSNSNSNASIPRSNVQSESMQVKGLFYLRVFFMLNVLIYLIPVTANDSAYQRIMLSAFGSYVLDLLTSYPNLRSQPPQQIAQTLAQDFRVHYAFSSLLFAFIGSSRVLYILPHLFTIIGHVADGLNKKMPDIASKISSATKLDSIVLPRITQTTSERWGGMSTANKWQEFNKAVLKYSAAIEVGIGFSLIVELFTPNRSLMLLLFYWNMILKIRYMMSPDIKIAFAQVDARLMSLCGNFQPLLKVYMKIRQFAASQARLPTPEEARAQQERGFMGNVSEQISQARQQCVIQ